MSPDYVVAMAWLALYVYGAWPEDRTDEILVALDDLGRDTPEYWEYVIASHPIRYG
jgi:hypothetical protein